LEGMGRHGVALHWGSIALRRHAIGKAWGSMPLGWHGVAWGGIALGQHAIWNARGSMPLGRHGAACHWEGMGRHAIGKAWGGMPWGSIAFGRQCHPCLPMTCCHNGTQCIAAPCYPNCIAAKIQDRWANSKLVAMGRQHGMAAAMHLGGIGLGRQCIKCPAFTNPALTGASQLAGITKSSIVKFGNYTGGKTPCMTISKIWHCHMPAITLAAKHLISNIQQ
jgi:hypothetical protein